MLAKDMKLLLARSLLNGLPLVDFILARLGSHCCLHTLQGHDGIVHSAQFNSAGDRIVTASWDNTAKIWMVLQPRVCIRSTAMMTLFIQHILIVQEIESSQLLGTRQQRFGMLLQPSAAYTPGPW